VASATAVDRRRARYGRGVRRRLWIVLAIATLVLAVGYGALRIATRESSTPASVPDAVDRFRAAPTAARELSPALRGRAPRPGTYVYATHGFEVSHVLGTRRHAYPARTTITVTASDAGCLRMRWDALATRWDAVTTCRRADGSWRLVSEREGHEFAGHEDRRTYRCTVGSTYRPARLTPGARWRSHCAIEGTTTADAGTVVGPRVMLVAGRRVATVLLEARTRVDGETVGAGTTRTWVQPGTGLVLRRTIANANSTDTVVGAVPYEERATLTLASLDPRR
jgi:hypothetical protein